MGFSVDMLRGDIGVVDHQLSRRALINEVKRGRVSRDSVCDAHPELIRAAKHLGEPSKTVCPICEEVNVVLVTYVFGHGLPSHGKCVTDKKDIEKLQRTGHEYAAYETISASITSVGGSVHGNPDWWGKRRLAYPIQKQDDGYYAVFNIVAPAGALDEVERGFRLSDDVLRHKLLRLPDDEAARRGMVSAA